jgi:integrase
VRHAHATASVLAVVDGGNPGPSGSSWSEVLQAAVRPEFTVDTYFPQRGEAILFGHVCAVDGCSRRGNSRPGRTGDKWLCLTHQNEWITAGRQPLDEWLADGVSLLTPWKRRLIPCSAAGCERSRSCGFWCFFHWKRWINAGRPDREVFAQTAPRAPVGEAACEVPGCRFPAMRRTGRLCDSHKRTADWCRYKGMCDDVDSFLVLLAKAELRLVPHYDFSELGEPLRSELRYVIQQRLDENNHALNYRRVASAAAFVAEIGVDSLLGRDQEWWEAELRGRQQRDGAPQEIAFIRYARLALARLRDRAYGVDPYSGDVWLIEELGIPEFSYQPDRTISFTGIEPAWFREMAKRWARWRLRSGISSPSSIAGWASVVKKFSEFLQIRGEPLSTPEALTRGLLEDYRAHVRTLDYSPKYKHFLVGAMKVLLDEVRANGWEPRLPPTAAYYKGEVPVTTKPLPRAIDEHVMRQIEAPENIARLTDPSTRHAVTMLIRTGLRTIDATRLPFDPVVMDAAGAPVLLYYNHKLKREAALPIDDTMLGVIRAQQDHVAARYEDGCPWLFPAGKRVGSPEPMPGATLRHQMQRWLADGEVRDVHGRHVNVTAHQFRHTLATRMINAEVPIVAISRLLDHSSIAMTEVYARLSDQALKREFEKYQQRVNIKGDVIPVDPVGLVSEAAWMKERIARAKQTLPNGYCGLPLQQSCPHPNACLTCDHFLTTEQFLPVHREQLAETERLITLAVEQGSERKREMNESVRVNLVRIIDSLEQVATEHQQEPADEEVSDAA